MGRLNNWSRQIRLRLSSMSGRSRLATAGLAALVLAGLGWLALGGRPAEWAPLADQPMAADQLASAQSILQERSIPFRVARDRLLVPKDSIAQVRSILAYEGVLGRPGSALENLADDNDIWRTQSQSERRWQAAKMATLSRLISEFPTVRSATVLLEPGSPKGLGRPAVEPTAAVHVSFKGDCRMTPQLARAIADLLSGSVAGLKGPQIRIVDNHGTSCRIDEAGEVQGCEAVALADLAPARPAGAAGRPVPTDSSSWASDNRVWAALLAAVGLACGYVAIHRRIRRIRRIRERAMRMRPGRSAGPAGGGRFAFLQEAAVDEIVALVRDEHPQTVALVLWHLAPQKAAIVLKALPPERQAEVAERVVHIDRPDADVLAEVERALAGRFAASIRSKPGGGIITMAQILQHAGYATEQTVLEALGERHPSLERAVRRPALVFEEIAMVPPQRLREALAELGSDELAVALRTAGKELKEKVLACLDAGVVRQVRREMERIGPVRLSDVESAQQHVVEAVCRLEGLAGAGGRSEIVA